MRTPFFGAVLALIFTLISLPTKAQVSVDGGGQETLLPLNSSASRPATDLFQNGHLLLPEDAANLGIDLSQLDPDPTTTLWTKLAPSPLSVTDSEKELAQVTSGKYLSLAASPTESFKFVIQTVDSAHRPITRTVTLGRYVHNHLLRKALLEKLGYHLPALSYLPKLEVQFNDPIEKKVFVTDLEHKNYSDTNRWIVSETDQSIVLQDLVISEDQDVIYNLATGFLTNDIIKGRRLLSSLIVPYVLTYVPESANLFSWSATTRYGDGVHVDYPNSDQFSPSADDVRWMLSRLSKLTRDDWNEVGEAAKFPPEVQALVVEKMISRRNYFLDLYGVPADVLEFNPKITIGTTLVQGEIKKKDWPGYASRFSFGDPDSPLNPGEMLAFTRSKIFSSLLSNAVNKLNALPFFQTDSISELEKHQAKILGKMIENYQQTGQMQKTPLGIWAFPFASGNLLFSREVVAGSYLGTNNLIQLVDQVGVRLSLGVELDLDGLPTTVSGSLRGKVSFSRTYSHVKPIKSVRKANHYGFQNAIVPFFMQRSAHRLDALFTPEFTKLSDYGQQKLYDETLQSFKEEIAPGESIVITDSLVGDGSLTAGVGLYHLIDLTATFETTELVIARTHLYRKDENTFQVYRDVGSATQPSFSVHLGLRKLLDGTGSFLVSDRNSLRAATLPLLKFERGGNRGEAKVQFYSVEIGKGDLADSIAQLKLVQGVLKSGSLEVLKSHVKPYLIENHFKEKNGDDRLLFFDFRRLRSSMDLSIENPKGSKRSFIRDFFGTTSGRNFENTAEDVLGFAAQLLTHANVDLGNDSSSNPGYSIFGRAQNRFLNFEAEVLPDGSLRDQFVKLTHLYNGWSLPKKGVQAILDRFSKDYGTKLFAPTALNETEAMFLYNISLNIHLYDESIKHLARLSVQDVITLFAKYNIDISDANTAERITDRLQSFQNTHSSKDLLRALSIADRQLPAEGFFELMGGKENIFVYAKIEGFRKGDENGDTPIISNTIGMVGSPKTSGPISYLQNALGIPEGEFLSNWITGKLL